LRELAEGLVDHWVERNDSPGKLPPHPPGVGEIGSGHYQRAAGPPRRQADEKRGAVLRKARGQLDDRDGTDKGADHAIPALAQRCSEMRLAHDRRRGAGPVGVVELEPECDIEREAHRSPQPQAKEQWRPGGPE
jgi:hypothetical protein